MTGRSNPSRESKFSGANGDREVLIFPLQLTTSKIGNLTRLIHTLLLYVMMMTIQGTPYLERRYVLGEQLLTPPSIRPVHVYLGMFGR